MRWEQLLDSGVKAHFKPLHMEGNLENVFSKEDYCSMVEKAKNYIHEGDIFQVVLSNPMEVKATGSLFDAYRSAAHDQSVAVYVLLFKRSD